MKFFSFTKKHPIKMSLIIGVILIVASFGLRVKTGKAIVPFGGPILDVVYCPCSANLAIIVGPPNGGIFTYDGSGIIDAFYQLFHPGPWVLGNYIPGSVGCWQFCVDCCYPMLEPIGTINEVGTSM